MERNELAGLSKDELVKRIEEMQKMMQGASCWRSDLEVDYQYIIENSADIIFIIFILDKEGKLVYKNKAGEDFFPIRREDAIGMHYSKYIPALELERAKVVFAAVLNEGKELRNERMKSMDTQNRTVYFIANFSPIRSCDGDIIGLHGILRNITDLHDTEKKLRENTRRLEEKIREQVQQAEELRRMTVINEEMVNNAPIAIAMMDPAGIMLSENAALKQIMGHKPNETRIGTNLSQYQGWVDAGLQGILDEAVKQRRPVRLDNVHYIPISRDRELILNARMNPIMERDGTVKSVLAMLEDITEQSKYASKMQRAEKLSAMGLLAAGVAYELKVPINLMAIDLNFISKNIDESSPVRDYLKSLKDELDRIKKITEQLLNLSKPEQDEIELIEVNKLLQSHPIQISLSRLQKNGLTVNMKLPDRSPVIRGTQSQVVQVLLHLISNAEDAMPDKGELTITVGQVESGGVKFAQILVADTGIGIPEENLKRIFQPFFSTKGHKSTGLGLMVTYSIIDNLGGTIGVKSIPGEGTAMRILIPAVE